LAWGLLDKNPGRTDPDDVPDPPAHPVTEPGEMWVLGRFSNRKPQAHAYAPLSPVLHYNPGHARTHSEAQVAQIAGSIREFGFTSLRAALTLFGQARGRG
jgi:hypothetical protein